MLVDHAPIPAKLAIGFGMPLLLIAVAVALATAHHEDMRGGLAGADDSTSPALDASYRLKEALLEGELAAHAAGVAPPAETAQRLRLVDQQLARDAELMLNEDLRRRNPEGVHRFRTLLSGYRATLRDIARTLPPDRGRMVAIGFDARGFAGIAYANTHATRLELFEMIDRSLQPVLREQSAAERTVLLAETDSTQSKLVLSLALAMAASAGGCWLLVRSLIRPIRAMTQTAGRIVSTGDLALRAEVPGDDELGDLAATFNTLISLLERNMISRRYLTDFLALTSEAIFLVEDSGRIRKSNAAAESMLGYGNEELEGMNFFESVLGIAMPSADWKPAKLLATRETEFVRRDRTRLAVLLAASVPVGEILNSGVVYAATDLSERKSVEKEMEQSRDAVQRLARHLQSAQESERARIARDLHDELGSLLTALKLNVRTLRFSPMSDFYRIHQQATAIEDLVEQAEASADRVVKGLWPQALDHLGLIGALEGLVESLKGDRVTSITASLDGRYRRLDKATEIALYRVAQEAITNVIRHAQARMIRLTLAIKETTLFLEVDDDGIGIQGRPRRAAGGYGIPGMRHRIAALGGELHIHRKERGTLVKVTVPYHPEQSS